MWCHYHRKLGKKCKKLKLGREQHQVILAMQGSVHGSHFFLSRKIAVILSNEICRLKECQCRSKKVGHGTIEAIQLALWGA